MSMFYKNKDDYRDNSEFELNHFRETYIYKRDVAEQNWKKIQENIASGKVPPIKMQYTYDGFEIPYGHDCFFDYGELMPDGVVSKHSIFRRDNKNGKFPWLGNYYKLKKLGDKKKRKISPLFDYDKDFEENIRLIRDFGTPMKKDFSTDNNNSL